MLTTSDVKFLAACGITVHSGELRPVLSTQDVVMDAPRVRWEWWRITQSEFRYREIGVVDLGDVDA
jgi:hypothetical protein